MKRNIQTALDKLDEMYERRAECAAARWGDDISPREIRVSEGEFDAYFKRSIHELETMLHNMAKDSQ